jgi:hypothetical protein
VRRAVAAEALVAALSGGKVGGLTYINNLTALMGPFVDRVVVEAAPMRRDRPDLAHMSFNARAKVYIQEIWSCRASQIKIPALHSFICFLGLFLFCLHKNCDNSTTRCIGNHKNAIFIFYTRAILHY